MSIPFIVGTDRNSGKPYLVVTVNSRTTPVPSTHPFYNEIYEAVKVGDSAAVLKYLDSKRTIVEQSNSAIELKNGVLYYKGEALRSYVAQKIVGLYREGFNIKPLVNFLERLMQNPSKRAVDELYGFLEQSQLPITEDGHFIAYKMIRGDYTDIYSGTMDNSVGTVVEMPRNRVDENKGRTCSDGLHFASLYYVTNGHYGSRDRGNRLVAVKIDPADVVSIPSDYNNSKGRACRYLILEELDWDDRIEGTVYREAFEDHDPHSGYDEDFDDEDGDDNVVAPTVTVQPANVSQKLTEDDVYEILERLDDGDSLTEIANDYEISRRQVARIRDGEAWGDIHAKYHT